MILVTIRPATMADVSFLWDMLFESAFTTDEERAAWRRDPQPPADLLKYLDGWGRPGDTGVVAHADDGARVGAAWYRLFPAANRGDGILAESGVPELAIAVEPRHRGCGIGGDLLRALERQAAAEGYRRLRLSVDPRNVRARRLYERMGFVLGDQNDAARGTSLIMDLTISPWP